MKRLVLMLFLLWGISAFGQRDTLSISTTQVVHLRFSSELKYVNLGSRDIVAKIVDGSKDFVAVKAREAFSYCTSMSCLETNGTMHTFLVAYSEEPGRLEWDMRAPADSTFVSAPSAGASPFNDIAAMPRELYHLGARGHDLEIMCENVFVKDDVLYLVFSLRNGSAVSYELSAPRFAVESLRRSRRGLQFEKAVFPRASSGLGPVGPGSVGRMVFAFDKVSLVKGQALQVYFYEKGGARNLVVTLGMEDVNRARRVTQ